MGRCQGKTTWVFKLLKRILAALLQGIMRKRKGVNNPCEQNNVAHF